jgi:quercetin dioxygenase-like cupin family protein
MIHYRSIVGVEERPMNLTRTWISMAVVVCGELLGTPPAWNQTGAPGQKKDRARVVMSQALPALDGDRLRAVLVEVRYGPGEASTRHSHPCAVIGYVSEGSLRTQLQGEPERIYHPGQTFYEAPNRVHLVSANASATEPAKLLAYFICDRDTPLTMDVPEHSGAAGASR